MTKEGQVNKQMNEWTIDVNYGNKMVETATTLNRNRLARTQKVQTKRRSRRDTDKIIGTRDVATIIGINGVMILLKEFTATKEEDDEQQKNK